MEVMEPIQTKDYAASIASKQSSLSFKCISFTGKAETLQEDIDPTPRPLRIIKRRPPGMHTPTRFLRSTSSFYHRSPSWKASAAAPMPIPRRCSSAAFSVSSNASEESSPCTPLSDKKGGSSSVCSFSSMGVSPSNTLSTRRDLKVQRKRRHTKSSTITEPVRDINDFYPQPSLSSSITSSGLREYSNRSKVSSTYATPPSRMVSDNDDTPKAKPVTNRGISFSDFLKAGVSPRLAAMPSSGNLLSPPSSAHTGWSASGEAGSPVEIFGTFSGARGQSDRVSSIAEEVMEPDAEADTGLQLSPKQKAISRVLGGFSMLSGANSLLGMWSGNVQLQRAASVPQAPQRIETTRHSFDADMLSVKSRSPTIASQKTTLRHPEGANESTNGSRSESARSKLALRIQSNVRTPSSLLGTGQLSLDIPRAAPLLQVKLDVTPEFESVDYENGQSLWVAIELLGDWKVTSMTREGSRKIEVGLDIVLLIHLPISTSPETLVGSRDICKYLASILDTSADRLAILSSYTSHGGPYGGEEFNVIFPLQPVNFKKVAEAVGRITGPAFHTSRAEGELINALQAALRLLHHPRNQDLRGSISKVFGHMFLVSDVALRETKLPGGFEAVQLHVVNPSIAPWPAGGAGNNGWHLDSLFSEQSRSTFPYLGDDSLVSGLNAVVKYARLGNNCGRLQDLEIKIKAASNCRVEAIMGDTVHPSLDPGQRILVFVKLKVLPQSKQRILSNTSSSPGEDIQASLHLWSQLDAILGQSKTEILAVDVHYRHSLFSKETTLSLKAAVNVHWHMENSSWSLKSNRFRNEVSSNQIRVQKILGHFVAGNNPDRLALSALRDIFGQAGALPSCLPYLRRLKKELRYRARRDNRRPFPLSGNASAGTSRSPGCHREGNGDISTTAIEPQNQDVTISDKSLTRVASRESIDEAARIWAKMREKTRVRAHWLELPDEPSGNENLIEIAEKALSNKRSLGPDTLKSIASSRRVSGPVVPWL